MTLNLTNLSGFGSGGALTPSIFVDSAQSTGNTDITLPSFNVGDICICNMNGDQSAPDLPSGFTSVRVFVEDTNNRQCETSYRVLQSGDTTIAISGNDAIGNSACFLYRGGSVVSFHTENLGSAGTTLLLGGFTKASGSRKIIGNCADQAGNQAKTITATNFIMDAEEKEDNFSWYSVSANPVDYGEGDITFGGFRDSDNQWGIFIEIT